MPSSPLDRARTLLVVAVVVLSSSFAAAQPAGPPAKPPPAPEQPESGEGGSAAEPSPGAGASEADPAGEGGAPGSAAPSSKPGAAPAGETAADVATAGTPGAEAARDLPPIDDDEKREVPDYDGRGDEPVDAGDVFIWVPRVVFAPVYLVSEYVIRWPLGKLVTTAEEHKLPAILVDFFTFGPEKKAGIVPTALVDFGLRTSVGFYFFWDDYFADGQDLRVRAATGGSHWFLANVAHRTWLDAAKEDTKAEARFEYLRRPDLVFHGIGPQALDRRESYYEAQRIEGGLKFYSRFWRTSALEAYLAVRDMSFFDEGCCEPEDIRLGTRVAHGSFPFPPGWDDGYTTFLQRAQVSLDTRKLRDAHVGEGSDFISPPGTGLRLQLRGQLNEGIRPTPRATPTASERHHWINYGGTLGGFLDLNGRQRVVGLSAIVDFADPLIDGSEIPFTELASLGGERPMRGFLQGRLLGRSSIVWRLEYRWPIWVWLDGAAHYSVGNAYGKHLEDFDAELLRQSFGMGIRSIAARDHSFELLLAFGTEPFDDGGQVENVRLVVGTSSGF